MSVTVFGHHLDIAIFYDEYEKNFTIENVVVIQSSGLYDIDRENYLEVTFKNCAISKNYPLGKFKLENCIIVDDT